MNSTQRIEISTKSLATIIAFAVGLWLIYEIWGVLVAIFVSYIVISALRPLVDRLISAGFPKGVAVMTVYFGMLLLLGLLLGVVIPPLIDQTVKLVNKIPEYIHNFAQFAQVEENLIDIDILKEQIAPISSNILKLTLNIFSNIVTVISFLVFTFYLLLERQSIENILATFLNRGQKEHAVRLLNRIESRLGAWSRGELVLMTIIGIITYAGLVLLDLPFALSLAVFAGIMEIIPVIGPIISAVPAVLVALTFSPILALAVGALYFIVQQLENHILVPKVMERAVGLSPVVTILAIAVGGKLLGIFGALLAVPVLVVLLVIIQEFLPIKHYAPQSDSQGASSA